MRAKSQGNDLGIERMLHEFQVEYINFHYSDFVTIKNISIHASQTFFQRDLMRTRKSSRKKKIKYAKIQELWFSFDVGPS